MSREPYVRDPDFTLWQGDALEVLRDLPDASVDCCVTSPPYWGLRDYGTGEWSGGDEDCDHQAPPGKSGGQRATRTFTLDEIYREECGRCGATRVDHQLGLEPTPEEYVAAIVAVFSEVRRVLSDTGTLWLNLGDSYSHGGNGSRDPEKWPKQSRNDHRVKHAKAAGGTKPKDMIGIPWRVAFVLQADGWYLRSDIIWSKPNPMPESVTDRPTKAHEYVFLLSKSARYYYDAEAIAEPATWYGPSGQPKSGPHATQMIARAGKNERSGDPRKVGFNERWDQAVDDGTAPLTRNARSVWTIQTQQYADAHFAVFPEELPRRCILAGCPEGGTILDPFGGSGTTALIARKYGRKSVLIELSPDYCALAAKRLSQLSLFAS